MDFNAIWARVQRAATLKPGVYAEIGADNQATVQAMVVVAIAALISGLGDLFTGDFGVGGWIFFAILAPTVGLAIGTGILFLVGRLFKGQGQYIELFRGLGYAYAPAALGIIPVIGGFVGGIWSVVLAIRAVKEINKVSDGAAIANVLIPVAVIGFLLFVAVVLIGLALFGLATQAGLNN